MTNLHSSLVTLFGRIEQISEPSVAWDTQSKWRAHFAPEWTNWTGVFGDRDWHVLSSRRVAHARGARAIAMYESVLHTGDVLVSVALGRTSVYRCKAPVLPSCAQLRAAWDDDLYVIAADWSWTFVLTHEELHGPYFVEAAANPWAEEQPDLERVFVRLLGEGTTVYRPTSAARIGPDTVLLAMPKDYDPDDEDWEFKPGSIVRIERRVLQGTEVQVAASVMVPEP